MRLTVDYVSSLASGSADATPGLGVSEGGALLRRGSHAPLYSLCWLDGPAAEETLPVVSDALHAEFAANAGRSLTSSLLRSVRTAMHTLERENASSLPKHRCAGSVCAAALKDDTLFLAAIGGAVAFAWRRGELRAVCRSECMPGLDSDDEAEIALGSARLEPGDAVILASPGFEALVSAEQLAAALATDGSPARLLETIEAVHVAASKPPTFAAVVLASPGEGSTAMRQGKTVSAPKEQPPAPQTTASPTIEAPVARPPAPASPAPSRAAPPPPRPEPAAQQAAEKETTRETRRGVGQPRPAVAGVAQRLLLRLSVVLVILATLAVGLYLGEGYISAQARQAQAAELLTSLEQKEKDALAATDPATRRWLLTEASRAADRALSVGAPSEKLTDTVKRIKGRLDEFNGVVRLNALQLLADFTAIDKATQPAKVIGAKDDLYVLDRGVGSVWHLRMGKDLGALGPPKALWKRGDTVSGASLGEATAFFWMYGAAPGIPEQLYVLDGAGALAGVSQGVVAQPMRVPGAGALAKVGAAAGQAGNLYVLDSQRRVIWRHTPGSSGYEAAGQEHLNEASAPELANVVDMALDGNFYLLLSDGRLVKYAGGRAQSFPAVVPDTPLRKPAAVFASPTTRHVYVADSGNARVVQFTKEGQYVRQFRAPNEALEGIRAVFVDEEAGRLYALVGSRAFVATVPADGKQ